MDNWNRNDQEQPNTVMNAQRRLRRRPDENDGTGPDADKPVFDAISGEPDVQAPAEPVMPEKAEEEIRPEGEEPAVPKESEKPEADIPAPREEPEAPAGMIPETQETAEKPQETGEIPAVKQAADSRIPPEARRMAAAPYGAPKPGAKRPGTRPQVAQNRPPVRAEQRPAYQRRPAPARQPAAEDVSVPSKPRVRVGYAPGRMAEGMTQMVPAQEEARGANYTRDARAYLEKKRQPFRVEGGNNPPPDRPQHKRLRAVVAVLAVIGLVLTGILFARYFNKPKQPEGPKVISFDLPDTENRMAPTDLTFSAVTEETVEDIRLSSGNRPVDTEATHVDTTVGRVWMMVMHVKEGFSGTVTLQVFRNEEEGWLDTDHQLKLTVEGPIATPTPGTVTPAVTATPTQNGAVIFADDVPTETPMPEEEDETPEPAVDEESPEEDDPADVYPEEDENNDADPEEEGVGEQAGGSDRESDFETVGELRTTSPTATPAPDEAAPTVTPPLEAAEAAPGADPKLITNVTVYTGNKKEKAYSRPAKEEIHMPAGDDYTNKKLGVMTFRGDNFRRNAAIGTLSAAPTDLVVMWEVEGGSLKGANQTYYGYGWPGQPAIARWSTQVRSNSNLYDSKQEKKALKEVIIAGLDGNIRFLDLQDGSLTRNSIKLGYPMRGTPSLDTRGAPFMTVGQFARKLKNKQGRIGLRQYNLYSQKEMKLIDGLDGKSHRPLNDIGSFNTSALIDRISDTVIAIGSNGALYLESMSSNFDFKAGVYQASPSITMMTSKAQGQKNTALMAVESSPAAYDKYVYYADMGGVLRCVDTNTLQPVWAVDTGDSVMAAVALDLTAERELNLYTANMLNNRKKGDGQIQIRKLDALSGRELWCTEVGVYKGKKDKDDVGAKASPVIGQKGLNDLVYYTVTGLSEDGRTPFGLSEEQAVVIALNKETGSIVWSFGLDSRCESSPVAVYDTDGRGWIIQCEQNGTIHLLDGLTGKEINSLKVNGEIEASPAVYSNVMVIGTTGKGTSFIYGIEIRNNEAPANNQQEDGDEEDSGGA